MSNGNSNYIERMIWTVVFRESANSPQEEYVRYTEEAADSYAKHIMDNGGVAVVVESSEPVDVRAFNRSSRGALEW